jgi:hypothetical protein
MSTQVITYIQEARKQGFSDEKIIQELLVYGWDKKRVTKLLKEVPEQSLASKTASHTPGFLSVVLALFLFLIIMIFTSGLIGDINEFFEMDPNTLLMAQFFVTAFVIGIGFTLYQISHVRKYLWIAHIPFTVSGIIFFLVFLFRLISFMRVEEASQAMYIILGIMIFLTTGAVIFYSSQEKHN